MSSNYQIYRKAAGIVRKGWLRGNFIDAQDNQCLVQSVLTAAEIPGKVLPSDMVTQIDARLRHYPSYRAMRAIMLVTYGNEARDFALQKAIMGWNDTIWRHKGTVTQVLDLIAGDLANQEIERLTAEVARLQTANDELSARVASLEAENQHLWGRLTNFFTLRADRAELERLSEELEQHYQELIALKV